MLEVLCAPSATGYPSFMGPGVPKERIDAIRAAYRQSLKDPEFIDAVLKQGLDLDPIGADELTDDRARHLCAAAGRHRTRARTAAGAVTQDCP